MTVAYFKYLWRSVDEKHLMRFQSENAVFKLLWRNICVDGALLVGRDKQKFIGLIDWVTLVSNELK